VTRWRPLPRHRLARELVEVAARWVAGTVRARALARRRLGRGAARSLATSGSLADAVDALAVSPYGHDVRVGQPLAAAQRAVGATLLWHLRVLAGWLPATGAEAMRVLAGWFEVANVDELLRDLAGSGSRTPPYRLGRLATAWPRLSQAASPAAVREVLATSAWGDPGGDTPRLIGLGMRVTWAARVAEVSEEARGWAAGGMALLLARERFAAGRPLPAQTMAPASGLLGLDWAEAGSLREAADQLARAGRWALAGISDPADLWQAEGSWWARVERDGFALLRRPQFALDAALGSVAVLAADAWRVSGALEVAARAGSGVEVFDALA
jgi:hypothetical protein